MVTAHTCLSNKRRKGRRKKKTRKAEKRTKKERKGKKQGRDLKGETKGREKNQRAGHRGLRSNHQNDKSAACSLEERKKRTKAAFPLHAKGAKRN